MKEQIVDLSEGISGAVVAMTELAKTQRDAPALLAVLEARDIRGSDVWVAYKDECGKDADAFADYLREKAPAQGEL